MRETRRIRSRLVIAIGVFVVGVAALRSGWLVMPRSLARGGLMPIERAAWESGEAVSRSLDSFLRIGTLTTRLRSLEKSLAGARAEIARLESIREENQRLRSALALLPRSEFRLVAAEVVGPSTDGVSSALRINRGARDGITQGSPVIAEDGILIGQVQEAHLTGATVDLLTGGRVRVSVRAVGTGAEGIVRGLRGLDVIVEGVPRTDELREGDRLVSSGIDGAFPPHLLIGTIQSVRSPEPAVFQEASVQLPLDLHRLKIVAVIIGNSAGAGE